MEFGNAHADCAEYSHAQLFDGDFYAFSQADDAVRGVTLAMGTFGNDPLAFDKLCDATDPFCRPSPMFSDDTTQPIELPRSGLTTTSVVLAEAESTSAAAVAISMYEFLSQQPTCSISKVSPQKFAMKADVFHEADGVLVHCELKVRIFKLSHDRYNSNSTDQLVVDFRRQHGDAVAFSHVFSEAVRHLRLGPSSRTAAAQDQNLTLATMQSETALEEADLQPLLAMVADVQAPAAQAEALAALVVIASVGATAALVVFASLRKIEDLLAELAASDRFDIAHPAWRLVSRSGLQDGTSVA